MTPAKAAHAKKALTSYLGSVSKRHLCVRVVAVSVVALQRLTGTVAVSSLASAHVMSGGPWQGLESGHPLAGLPSVC